MFLSMPIYLSASNPDYLTPASPANAGEAGHRSHTSGFAQEYFGFLLGLLLITPAVLAAREDTMKNKAGLLSGPDRDIGLIRSERHCLTHSSMTWRGSSGMDFNAA